MATSKKTDQFLVVRWNGTGVLYLSYMHPVHGAMLDLKLNPRAPQPIDPVWLRCPQFAARAVEGAENCTPDKISYWWQNESVTFLEFDFSDLSPGAEMTPDLRETLRQVLLQETPSEQLVKALQMKPGIGKAVSRRWVIDYYRPFLNRVISEEKRFRNREGIIAICEQTLEELREYIDV